MHGKIELGKSWYNLEVEVLLCIISDLSGKQPNVVSWMTSLLGGILQTGFIYSPFFGGGGSMLFNFLLIFLINPL